MMFFAKPGKYEACGIFSKGHFILFLSMIIIVFIALYMTNKKSKEKVQKIIKNCTIFLWVLEVIKIVFNLLIGNISKPNSYIPLYYCSLILYTGLFSSFGKGIIKRIGDIFLATGAIIAGLCFAIIPSTSLTIYPLFHYISIQSFILHGIMIYIGLLVNITNYVEYDKKDFKYYFLLIIIIGISAYLVNCILGTNLMFVSKNYPGTPIEIIYNLSGKFYPVVSILAQAIIPFFLVIGTKDFINNRLNKMLMKLETLGKDKIEIVE